MAGLAAVLMSIAVVAPVAARTPVHPADAPPMLAFVNVNDCKVHVLYVPQSPTPDPAVTITVKRGSTQVAKVAIPSAGEEATGTICPKYFRIGDTIKLAANGESRTITVPPLSARIAPATKRVSGVVPAGGLLQVAMSDCQLYPGAGCGTLFNGIVATAPETGAWSVDLGTEDTWKPGFNDHVEVDWTAALDGLGDHFLLKQLPDSATIRVGSAGVVGAARPGSTVTLSLVAPGGAVRGRATAIASGKNGAWTATLRAPDGAKVRVRVGDTLRTSLFKTKTKPGASIKAVDLRATVLTDETTAINGNVVCAPGRRIGVYLHPAGSTDAAFYYEDVADADGRMSISDTVAVPLDWAVEAHCVNAQFLDQVAYDITVAP